MGPSEALPSQGRVTERIVRKTPVVERAAPEQRCHCVANARSMTTRTRLAILSLVLTIFIAACGSGDPNPAPGSVSAGTPVPSTEFTTFDGTSVTLADYGGKPVVVNFWASWCPSCVAEMSAAFRPVQADLGEEVTFIGMNIQDDRALAERLLEETGVAWISAEDPDGDLYLELGGIAMPFTVYVSADGRILDKHNGPLTESQLRQQIAEILG